MATATVEGIYISAKSAAPMQSLQRATCICGVGIEGDRYALQTGTYSATFFGQEPGKHLTLVSADGVEARMAETGLEPLESMADLRRNVVVRGLTAEAVNNMIGHEVTVGSSVRLFAHRRTVPCRYREGQTKRPGLMNKLWDVCGVNCEILQGGEIRVGDAVAVVRDTHQPQRVDPGQKPPGFFVRPSERSAEQAKSMIIPAHVAAAMCLADPIGFQRVEDGYQSAGQHFWTPKAYRAAMRARTQRTVKTTLLAVAAGVVLLAAVAYAGGMVGRS
jgi:hypothetical protein